MADLDSLKIQITASASSAQRAIDKLTTSLIGLGNAMNMGALNTFVARMQRLADISKTLNGRSINNITKAIEGLETASGGIEGIANLSAALETLPKSVPDFSNLTALSKSAKELGGTAGSRAGTSMVEIANGLNALENAHVKPLGDDAAVLTKQLRALGSKSIANAATRLPEIARGLEQVHKAGDFNSTGITQLTQSLGAFGRKSAQTAITTIPLIAKAYRELIETLAKAPTISQKVIDLANAMANLSSNMRSVPAAVETTSKKLVLFRGHAQKTQKSAFSLAATIGKLYASFWMFMRVGRWFGESMKLASDLVEVQNVVDNVFTDMSDKMEDFAKTSVDTLGMSELTAKQIASRFQAMGVNMGVPKSAIESTNEFLQATTKMRDGSGKAYADVAHSMADISLNLTKLAGDMASFYNQSYADVAKDLESTFTGMTKPLRQYGLDITENSMKEFAMRNGMNANIKTMSQYEKMLLRYQYIMANTTAAHGDFIRTQETWANQIKIATERIIQLKKVLGTIGVNTFKPLVKGFNNAMNTIIHLAESTLNALGKIFGWHVEIADVGTLADDTDDMAENLDDAAGSAKKMKDYMLGIDELNVFNADNGGGGGGDVTDGAADATEPLVKWEEREKAYDSIYDTLYKLGKRMGEIEKQWLEGIDWDAVYDKAERFGKGLAQVLNGYLSDAELFYRRGEFVANTINAIAHALKSFAQEFNGYQLGIDIGSWINGLTENIDWNTIKKAAEGIAKDIAQTINGAIARTNWKNVGKTIGEGINTAIKFFSTLGNTIQWKRIGKAVADSINGLFATIDFKAAGKTVSAWAKGILDLFITALEKTDWKKVGRSIGEFIAGIDFVQIGLKIGRIFWDVVNAGIKAYVGMFEAAPIESALLGVLALPGLAANFTTGIGKLFSNAFKNMKTDFDPKYLMMNINDALSTAAFTSESGGTIFQTLAAGVNQFSQNLSTATKVVGGFIGVAAEFTTIKDSLYEIVTGTGDVNTNLLEMVGVTTAVGTALSLVLGFPAGIIATGIAGLVGGIIGVNQALDQVRENTVLEILTTTYNESAITVDEIAKNFKTIADNIESGLSKLHGKYEDLQTLKGNLNDVAGGYDIVATAVANGTSLTSGAFNDLIGDLDKVEDAWQQYLDAHYDFLIQTVAADYNFAKSQGILTKEMEDEYINRIKSLSKAHDMESEELQGVMDDVKEARRNYDQAMSENVNLTAIHDAEDALDGAIRNYVTFAEKTGVVKNEVISGFEDISEAAATIDFSNLDSSSYEAFAADLITVNDGIKTDYQNTYDDILRKQRETFEAMGDEEYAAREAQKQISVLNQSFQNAMDTEMVSLYDKFYKIIATGDYDAAKEYADNVITPFVDSIQEDYIQASNGAEPFLREATKNLLEGAFDTVTEWKHDAAWATTTHTLTEGWIQTFWDIRNEATAPAKQAMQEMVDDAMDVDTESKGKEIGKNYVAGAVAGIEENSETARSATEDLGDIMYAGAASVLEINSPSRKAYEIGQYFDEGLANGITENTGLVEAAINEMMVKIESVYDTAANVFKPDAFINYFTEITGGMTRMIAEMKTSLEEFDENVKTLISEMFEKLLPTSFEGASKQFTTELGNVEKSINTFDENLGKKINTLFDETMPTKLKEAEKTVGSTVTNIQKKFESFLNWFDKNIVTKTKSDYWTKALSGIPGVFETTFHGVANSIATIMNTLIEQINNAMNVKWDNLVVNGQTVMAAGQAKLFEISPIPMYERGGFPEDGLFYANHNELVGGFANGKTAVANNEQIVGGIREGVQEAMTDVVFNMLNPYLSDIAQSSRETANKDFSVNIGDRDIAMANNRGQSLVGMQIIS